MTVILNIIIALVVVEAAVIVWRRFADGETGALLSDLAPLVSGLCLILAVRIAWTQSSAIMVILLVTLSGAAHAFDMLRRFRTPDASQKIGRR